MYGILLTEILTLIKNAIKAYRFIQCRINDNSGLILNLQDVWIDEMYDELIYML